MRLPFQKVSFSSTAFLPVYYLFNAGMLGFLAFFTLINTFQIASLRNKPAPSLVQMVDGKVYKVNPADADYRSPEVLKRLVQDWATLTLTWSGQLPDGKPDPGRDINGSKVPTSAWEASFVLSEDFRAKFLESLSQISSKVGQQRGRTALQIQQISLPKLIANHPNQWQVDIVANILIVNPGYQESFIPFNKRIFLQAVPLPTKSLQDVSTPLQKIVERCREAGLEIYKIQDLPSSS